MHLTAAMMSTTAAAAGKTSFHIVSTCDPIDVYFDAFQQGRVGQNASSDHSSTRTIS